MSPIVILLAIPILFVIELIYFKIALRYNIADIPNQRSSHKSVTLRGGGIIFYLSAIYYLIATTLSAPLPYPWFMLGLTLIAVVSFIDDIAPLTSKLRLLFHFAAMLLMLYQLGLISNIHPWWYIVIALIVCTGVINAYNFMDGINGITGAYSLLTLGTLAYINQYQIAFIDPNLIYITMAGVFVFNLFNFRKKAKCFAGDVGSVSIAFIILFILGSLIITSQNFSYLLILGVYGVDTVLTIMHRIKLRENILDAHRKHAYQLMANELKIPHLTVSTIYTILQAAITAGLIYLFNYCYIYSAAVIVVLATIYIIFINRYFKLHLAK